MQGVLAMLMVTSVTHGCSGQPAPTAGRTMYRQAKPTAFVESQLENFTSERVTVFDPWPDKAAISQCVQPMVGRREVVVSGERCLLEKQPLNKGWELLYLYRWLRKVTTVGLAETSNTADSNGVNKYAIILIWLPGSVYRWVTVVVEHNTSVTWNI